MPAGGFGKIRKLLSSEINRILIAASIAKPELPYPEGTILKSARPQGTLTLL
jgi:hypothetical protein